MMPQTIMSIYGDLFKFAAKAGSLEGYLFQRKKVEPLANWVGNIDRMYHDLPAGVRKDIAPDLREVLQKALNYGDHTIEPQLRRTIEGLLAEI